MSCRNSTVMICRRWMQFNYEQMTATFHQKPHAVSLKINPDTGGLIHMETY